MLAIKQHRVLNDYNQYVYKKRLILFIIFLLTAGMGLYAISVGSSNLSVIEVIKTLIGQGSKQSNMLLYNIRLPRVAMAIVSGVGLAITGCVMQSILKNPLASASTLGVSQGAAFGAALAIVYFGAGSIQSNTADAVAISNPYMTSICAFIGSMGATVVILLLSRFKKVTPETMVLAGVAISSLFSGATALIQYFANDVQVAAIVFWTFGDLGRASWREILIVTVVSGLALIYFMYNRWNYNALESGEQTAKGLGVNVSTMRIVGMVISSLTASVIVSFVGIINFIGLIAPHIMRKFVGNDYRYLIPASAILGAFLLLFSDTIARMVISPIILPIGTITSFMGAPLFLYILFKGVEK
ncbi:MAG: iron ABC transporter permease [Terrisporobacter othiniensis]|uniref:FecCD family ABC transporter permease n=1 Tax=Terrisporobacter petrolearius TaxID=1460447 RepID=UPI0022E4D73A|nr:iron ABC transporter permease [Terrisporobacter petrolearius]MDU4861548.1 iron ABC transporter permease [Terrisporobacter othiniensis]MDU6995533.1 iron ABC transporter permease [Terrisporobacter othiniensis]